MSNSDQASILHSGFVPTSDIYLSINIGSFPYGSDKKLLLLRAFVELYNHTFFNELSEEEKQRTFKAFQILNEE